MFDNFELRGQIEGDLQPGERLLWIGKPTPMRAALQHLGSLVSGLVTLGFIAVWLSLVSGMGADFPSTGRTSPNSIFSFFGLIGLIFVGVGLFTTLKPVWEYLKAGRTVYAITEQRALIIEPGLTGGKNIRSYHDEDIRTVERREVNNGMGDLIFARETYYVRTKYGRRERTRNIGFWGVENVREVERVMLDSFKNRDKISAA